LDATGLPGIAPCLVLTNSLPVSSEDPVQYGQKQDQGGKRFVDRQETTTEPASTEADCRIEDTGRQGGAAEQVPSSARNAGLQSEQDRMNRKRGAKNRDQRNMNAMKPPFQLAAGKPGPDQKQQQYAARDAQYFGCP